MISLWRNRVPEGIFSSSNRHWALGWSRSFTFQAKTRDGSHSTTYDVVSHTRFASARSFLPRNDAPTLGPSPSIQSAPWNSSLNRAEMFMSLANSQTRSGEAAMSISTVTPGAAAMSELTSPGFSLVYPHRSNQTISEVFRRDAGLKSVPMVQATGSSTTWVTPSGIPSSSANSLALPR